MTSKNQIKVSDFVEKADLSISVEARLLDLTSEIGELAKECLKNSNYGKNAVSLNSESTSWSNELGDVYFSLLCLADLTGVDIEEALDNALQKYETRLADSGDAGSGNISNI